MSGRNWSSFSYGCCGFNGDDGWYTTTDASAIAIGNLLGLICDPIAGLVEFPCQSRNAMGASNGLISSELVLSGIKS